jgi:hypothetical protein
MTSPGSAKPTWPRWRSTGTFSRRPPRISGDGAAALRALADDYERRLQREMDRAAAARDE